MELNTMQLLATEIILVSVGIFLCVKCIFLKKDHMDFFLKFIVVMNLFLLINIPVRMVELQLFQFNRILVYWMYDASVVLMNLMCFYWLVFILKQLESKIVDSILKIHILMIPALCVIPLCVVNRWSGWLYYIDESSFYHRGSIFILQGLVGYIYLFGIILSVLVGFFRAEDKKGFMKFVNSIFPEVVGIVLQIVFGGSYLIASTLYCALMMYIEICLDRQKAYELNDAVSELNDLLVHTNSRIASNMRTIIALSDIYHIMYDMNLEDDSFVEVKSLGDVSKFSKQFKSASEWIHNLPRVVFYKDYIPLLEEYYDVEKLKEYLKDKASCFVDGKGLQGDLWLRTNFVVGERDSKGNPVHIIVSLQDVSEEVRKEKQLEEALWYKKHASELKVLFTQTTEALAIAIDAKDRYTHGHSVRVADYSRRIAMRAGFDDSTCEEIYFAGLLHDVGKIGIPDSIINKDARLTPEEYEQVKKHPELGKEILRRISKMPFLSVGANYHHEWYNGQGYPSGLKATDIPFISRIIAVADAYDAMTSRRSYRNPLPQETVKNELRKGSGSQFDPVYAEIMLQMMEEDKDYSMKDRSDLENTEGSYDIVCDGNIKQYSEGIRLDDRAVRVSFDFVRSEENSSGMPSLVLFDSQDRRVHEEEREQKDLLYFEYCDIRWDGIHRGINLRDIKTSVRNLGGEIHGSGKIVRYDLSAVKCRDHVLLRLSDGAREMEATVALPDGIRFAYLSLTGEHCHITNICVEKDTEEYDARKITRLVPEVSYIEGPEGDIPSVEIDGWREKYSQGIQLKDRLTVSFHAKCLPHAMLVWHCPFVFLYTSEDGQVNGPGYREFNFLRFDGESWQNDSGARNSITVERTDDFKDWEQWKWGNKNGRDITLEYVREGNKIFLSTECGGLVLRNVTELTEDVDELYVALSGDLCVIENIRIGV